MDINKQPQVGVGCCIIYQTEILLGLRKGSHGEGQWALPGGKIRFGEAARECAKRGVLEDTGIDLSSLALMNANVSDDFFSDDLHFVTINFYVATPFKVKPKLMEPGKCSEWRWFSIADLPKNLFMPTEKFIKALKNQLAINAQHASAISMAT